MKLKVIPKSKGFTLIESLVAVAIIAILSVFGVNNIVKFQKNAILDQSAIQIEDLLKTARSKSITAESVSGKGIDFYQEDGLPTYGVKVAGSSATLFQAYLIPDLPNPPKSVRSDIETINLDPGITISSGETVFNRRNGQVSGSNSYLLEMGAAEKRKIEIDSEGTITINRI